MEVILFCTLRMNEHVCGLSLLIIMNLKRACAEVFVTLYCKLGLNTFRNGFRNGAQLHLLYYPQY